MSSSNVAHVSSVDKGLKMKIKRTKGPSKVEAKHEVVKSDSQGRSSLSGPSAAALAVTVFSLTSTTPSVTSLASGITTSACSASFSFSTSGSSLTPTTDSNTPLTGLSTSSMAASSVGAAVSLSTVTTSATNPTVALLKGIRSVMSSDYLVGSNLSNSNKSSSKTTSSSSSSSSSSSAPGSDASKDAKSPKTKAALNKKVKENKGKSEVGATCLHVSSTSSQNSHAPDPRTGSAGGACGSPTLSSGIPFPSSGGVSCGITSEPRPGDTVHVKREHQIHDPYEFNAKVEDKIELPPKKLKLEKTDCSESASSPQSHPPTSPVTSLQSPPLQFRHVQQHRRSVGVDVRDIGVTTEPESLGPCEPGTLVGLEGIVWKETDNGLLVINVTWRGKTYVGTLMDATRYTWAPPRPSGCESPVSDFESRAPKGRSKRSCRGSAPSSEKLPEGRRLRKGRRGTVNSSCNQFPAPPSPATSDTGSRRKTKTSEVDQDNPKRSRPSSEGVPDTESPTPEGYFECPEPSCHKKYKHMNGLRYHRTHAHSPFATAEDTKCEENEEEAALEKSNPVLEKSNPVLEKSNPKEVSSVSEKVEKSAVKEKQKSTEEQSVSTRSFRDSLEGQIPLKDIVNKVIDQMIELETGTSAAKCDEDPRNQGTDSPRNTNSTAICIKKETQTPTHKLEPELHIQIKAEPVSSDYGDKIEPHILLNKLVIHEREDRPGCLDGSSSRSATPKPDSGEERSTASTSVPSTPTDRPPSIGAAITTYDSELHPATPGHSLFSSFHPASTPPGTCSDKQLSRPGTNHAISSVIAPALISLAPSQPGGVFSSTTRGGTHSTSDKQSVRGGTLPHKSVSASRPIVPAPATSQSFGSHLPSGSPLSASAHSSLKPIQPKPTVLGEYSPLVNKQISNIGKDKSKKSKKKEKNHEPTTPNSNHPSSKVQSRVPNPETVASSPGVAHQDLSQMDKTSIKNGHSSNPSKPMGSSHTSPEALKLPFQTSVNSHKFQNSLSPDNLPSGKHRAVVPPSSLQFSPLSEGKLIINEDVHSPAYSDISDANDSNSDQQDSPKKDSVGKKEAHGKKTSHQGSMDTATMSQPYDNMYFYRAHSDFLARDLSSSISSPTRSEGMHKKEDSEEKGQQLSSGEGPQNRPDERHHGQESDFQQNSLMNYLAQLRHADSANMQLQYNFPNYSSSAGSSPFTLSEQQNRLHRPVEQVGGSEDNPDTRMSPGMPARGHASGGKHAPETGSFDKHWAQRKSNAGPDPTARAKMTEAPRTSREHEQSKPSQGPGHDQQNRLAMQQSGHLRSQLNHHQKQKFVDNQRHLKHKKTSSTATNGPIGSDTGMAATSRNPADSSHGDLLSADMIKKEVTGSNETFIQETKDSSDYDNNQGKCSPASGGNQMSKCMSPAKSSSANIPHTPSSTTSSLMSSMSSLPSSASTPMPLPLVSPLPPAGLPFSYPQYYSHLRPVQLDTMYRALGPHLLGYGSPHPGYLHPSQLGYRLPVVDPYGQPPDALESLEGEGPARFSPDSRLSSHKIHELQDKGRPSPGVRSPAPTKPASGTDHPASTNSSAAEPPGEKSKDKQREYSNSPPTQRHVHTHHHTHVVSGFPPIYPPDPFSKLVPRF